MWATGNSGLSRSREKYQARAETMHCEITGVGKPLILIHGLSGSSRWWDRNVAYLAGRYNVHVIDLNGFGQSNRSRFTLSETAEVVTRWMDRRGIDKASVMGHSMGGYVTVDLAATFPDRVDRIVLVDALAMPIGRSLFGNAAGLLGWLRYTALDFLPVVAMDAYRAGPLTLFTATRQVLSADIRHKLEHVKAPSLIIWGENDTVLPLSLGKLLHEYLPHAEFEVIPNAGHNPMWDRPYEFNHTVDRFLSAPSRRKRRTA